MYFTGISKTKLTFILEKLTAFLEVRHSDLIALVGFSCTLPISSSNSNELYLLTTYAEFGSLMELKQTDPEYFTKPNNIEDFAIQMIDIFNYMTKLGWSHRNLSPSNILCDNGKSKGSYLFKSCDWSSIVEKK